MNDRKIALYRTKNFLKQQLHLIKTYNEIKATSCEKKDQKLDLTLVKDVELLVRDEKILLSTTGLTLTKVACGLSAEAWEESKESHALYLRSFIAKLFLYIKTNKLVEHTSNHNELLEAGATSLNVKASSFVNKYNGCWITAYHQERNSLTKQDIISAGFITLTCLFNLLNFSDSEKTSTFTATNSISTFKPK